MMGVIAAAPPKCVWPSQILHASRVGIAANPLCTLQGRKAEAVAIMERMAQQNGTRMPLEPLADPAPEPGEKNVCCVSLEHMAHNCITLKLNDCLFESV